MLTRLIPYAFFITATAATTVLETDLQEDINKSWSLSQFADMIRRAILISVPFPWETVEKILDTDTEVEVVHLAKEMITHEMPLLIPACLGLVLAVLVPIFTLLFCCCRCCCGCCGAKLTIQNVRKHKLHFMFINSGIIVVIVGCLSAMACCMPISGNRLQTSPRLIFRAINTSLDDISGFFDNFVNDTTGLAMDVINTTVDNIKKDLDDLPDTLSEPVTDGARTIVDQIESNIYIISSEIDLLEEAEVEINSTVDAMIQYSDDLQTGITNINGLYITIKTECKDAGKSFCDSLPDGTGPDALSVSINNSKLTDIADEVSKIVAEANKVNLTEYSTLGNTTFEEIPKTIKDSSQEAIDGVKATLDTVHDDMKPEIDSAVESAKFDMDLSDTLEPLDETISMIESNKSTIGSGFAVLGFIFFTIGMVAFVGMMLGILCTKRTSSASQTGRTKAGNCGACLLMTSVGLAVVPLFLILLLGSVFMLLGGNVTILCAPLQDLTVFRRLVDSGLLFGGENLGEKFFNDESLNLSVTNLFKTCQNDGTVYSGLNLESVMNLSTLFNASEFVPDLGDDVVTQINDTIKDISIVNTSSFDDLTSKLDLSDIDTNIAQEIVDELNGIDLEEKSQEINDLADTIPDPEFEDKYRTISIGLQELHNDSKVPLLQAINNLTTILDDLNSTSQAIKVVITELSDDLTNLTNFVQDNAANVVLEALNDFLDGMTSVPDVLIGSVTDALNTDIGRCKVLSDVYDTAIGSFCTHFLDSFNVLWASFYTSGLLVVVLMISSCTLSKYFRRPSDIGYGPRNRTNNAHPSPSSTNVDLIYYKTLSDGGNVSNNASRTNYQRLHKKWRHRRHLITGPFTAHFLAQDVQGKSPGQTSNMKEAKQDKNDSCPLCSVVELDSTKDYAWCRKSSPLFEGSSSQDMVNDQDTDQKLSDPTVEADSRFVNKKESLLTYQDKSVPVRPSVESEDKVKGNSKCDNEITALPYLQLKGNELVLLPMTKLLTESVENTDHMNAATKNMSNVENITADTEHKEMSRWLDSYVIQSTSEQSASPLIKYSSDNEKLSSRGRNRNVNCNAIKFASKTSKHVEELDYFNEEGEKIDASYSSNTDNIHKHSGDGANLYIDTRKSELQGKNRFDLNDTDYPVQNVTCALCKTVGIKNTQWRNAGTMEASLMKPNTEEAGNDIERKNVKAEDDDCLTDFRTDGAQLSKSLENSFQTFDNTLFTLTSEGVCDQKKMLVDCASGYSGIKNKHVSHQKIDLKVKPYKPMRKPLSPQAAFHFWKYIEANCSCPSNNADSLSQKQQLHSSGLDTYTDKGINCLSTEYVEIFPRSNQEEQSKIPSQDGPESLVNLAINASKLAYIPEHRLSKETDRKEKILVNEDEQEQVPRCQVASTRKDNIKLSYV